MKACLKYGLLLACILNVGCTAPGTIRPAPVTARVVSFDGADQNGGVISVGPHSAVITPHAVDRFNAMQAKYGKNWTPPLQPIIPTGGPQTISRQTLLDFEALNRMRKGEQ